MILAMLLLDDGGSEILETWKDSMFEILIYSGPYYCHYDAIMCHYIDSLHFAMVICVVFFFHCFRHVDCHGKSAILHKLLNQIHFQGTKGLQGVSSILSKKNTRNSL